MPEICQIVQNLDCQGPEGKSFFQIFKWGCVLRIVKNTVWTMFPNPSTCASNE